MRRLGLWLLALGLLSSAGLAQQAQPPASFVQDDAALGQQWAARGDLLRALAHWERLSAPSPLIARQMASAYLSLGQWGQAVPLLERLLQERPGDAWANYSLGAIWAASDAARARPYLRALRGSAVYAPQAQALLPLLDAPDRPAQVGRWLAQAGDWSLAEWAFTFDYAWNGTPRSWALVGLLRELQGADGGSMIAQAIAQDDEDALIHYAQGIYWRNRQQHEASLGALQLAHALHADNPIYWAEIAMSLRLLGRESEAQDWIAGARRLAGDEAALQAALGGYFGP